MSSYRPPQRIFPLGLLAQLMSRYASCCLKISSGSNTWLIYLEKGALTYATDTSTAFIRLDRQLHQLSRQVPVLVSAVRVQMRSLFESVPLSDYMSPPDYQAIHWLVQQQYLNQSQANQVIEAIAQEVLETFLNLTQGNYSILEKDRFSDYPCLGQFDLRQMVEQCQTQMQQKLAGENLSNVTELRSQNKPYSETELQSLKHRFRSQPVTHQRSRDEAPATSRLTTSGLPKSHYTIACIDDSRTVLESIKTFLDDDSFAVLMINDPVKALMEVVRNKPDLILLDVGMPNLDGYELCSLLRRHPHFKHIPIVMVTGHTGLIDRAKAKLVGASGYLTKPFTQPDLLKVVFKHLAN